MKFNIWNSILCNHFFSRNDVQVFLSIDKDEIENIAIESEEFVNQIKLCGKADMQLEEKKKYAWHDFILIFGKITNGKWQCSKSILLADFQRRIIESGNSQGSIPTFLPYIALFVIPLSNDPELNVNAFYPKINDFFRKQGLIKSNESIGSIDMSQLRPGLDFMWQSLAEWATANDYTFKVTSRSNSGRTQYAYPFVSQLIFTATQRDKFKLLFYHAGLTPAQEIDEKYAEKILSNHYKKLGITQQRWSYIKSNYLSSAISLFFQEFNSWDGIAMVKDKRDSFSSTEYLGISQSLILHLSIYRGKFEYGLKANLQDGSFGEEFSYESNMYGKYIFSIDNKGFADEYVWNDNICNAISIGDSILYTKSGDKKTRLSYFPTDIEILEYSFGVFVSSKRFQKGKKYAILIRNNNLDSFSNWLSDNNAKLIESHQLRNTHKLYIIDSAISDISTCNVKKIHFDNRKNLELTDTIALGKTSEGVLKIYRGLPAYFKISGVDVSSDHIRAVFNSEGHIDTLDLCYNEESGLWVLPIVSNIFMQQKSFQIFCNDILISNIRFIVSDFSPLKETQYEELRFNHFGEYDTNGDINGLQLKYVNDVNWNNLQQSMSSGAGISEVNNHYDNSDYLLYYLSTRPRCEKKDFIKIIDVLIQNKKFKFDKENRWAIRSIIDNYFRLGYINYAYVDGQHIIAVNRPTLVLLPPKTKRECVIPGKSITRIVPIERFWTAMLTGARTPDSMSSFKKMVEQFRYNGEKLYIDIEPSSDGLLPQTVFIKSYSIDAIQEFAHKNYFQFQKCIYSNVLLRTIASIPEYIDHITKKESYDRYDSISNFSRIDYLKLANGDYSRINDVSKEKSIVTYFPGTFREQTILWLSGKQYKTDKHWGHLIGMSLDNSKVIRVNADKSVLELPIVLQLPQLFARALTLVSGKIPKESEQVRTYEIYNNPYIQAVDSNSILKKLSQL